MTTSSHSLLLFSASVPISKKLPAYIPCIFFGALQGAHSRLDVASWGSTLIKSTWSNVFSISWGIFRDSLLSKWCMYMLSMHVSKQRSGRAEIVQSGLRGSKKKKKCPCVLITPKPSYLHSPEGLNCPEHINNAYWWISLVSVLLKPLGDSRQNLLVALGTRTRASLSLTLSSHSLRCLSSVEGSAPLLIVKVIFLTVQRSMGWQQVSIKAVLTHGPLIDAWHDGADAGQHIRVKWDNTVTLNKHQPWFKPLATYGVPRSDVWSNICFTAHLRKSSEMLVRSISYLYGLAQLICAPCIVQDLRFLFVTHSYIHNTTCH